MHLEQAWNIRIWYSKLSGKGFSVKKRMLISLLFRDDQIMFTHAEEYMRYYVMKALIDEYKKLGPDINMHKLEYLCVWGGVAF
jgi:hypothetical protein